MPSIKRAVVPELRASSTSEGSMRPSSPTPSTLRCHRFGSLFATSTLTPKACTTSMVARQSAPGRKFSTRLIPLARAVNITPLWDIDLSGGTSTVPRRHGGLTTLRLPWERVIQGNTCRAYTRPETQHSYRTEPGYHGEHRTPQASCADTNIHSEKHAWYSNISDTGHNT